MFHQGLLWLTLSEHLQCEQFPFPDAFHDAAKKSTILSSQFGYHVHYRSYDEQASLQELGHSIVPTLNDAHLS
jgi:hypothetical protein